MSIQDDVDELGLALEYHWFVSDPRSPLMDFDEWKAKRARPVPTNPVTRSLLDQIAETNIRSALTATDINHD